MVPSPRRAASCLNVSVAVEGSAAEPLENVTPMELAVSAAGGFAACGGAGGGGGVGLVAGVGRGARAGEPVRFAGGGGAADISGDAVASARGCAVAPGGASAVLWTAPRGALAGAAAGADVAGV